MPVSLLRRRGRGGRWGGRRRRRRRGRGLRGRGPRGPLGIAGRTVEERAPFMIGRRPLAEDERTSRDGHAGHDGHDGDPRSFATTSQGALLPARRAGSYRVHELALPDQTLKSRRWAAALLFFGLLGPAAARAAGEDQAETRAFSLSISQVPADRIEAASALP